LQIEFARGVLERGVGGVVRAEFGIEVAQDSDAHGVAHLSIVLDEDCPKMIGGVLRGVSIVVQ
jgi:hypothetical protein